MIYTIEIAKDDGIKYERITYPAGEYQVRLFDSEIEEIAKASEIHVIMRGSLNLTNGNQFMELALLTSALRGVNHWAKEVLFLPYLPYGRADRRFTLGDCHGLSVYGNMLDTLGYRTIVTLDNHSKVSHGKVANLYNVDATSFIQKAVEESGSDVIILPDAGARRYRLDNLDLPVIQCIKRRDPMTGVLSGFEVPKFKEKYPLIIDDICDGGGTFIGIAKEVHCPYLNLYVTHGIFSKGLSELDKHFHTVYTTDSFRGDKGNLVKTFPCMEILKEQYETL